MKGSIKKRCQCGGREKQYSCKHAWTIIIDAGYQIDPATGGKKRRQKSYVVKGNKGKAQEKLNDLLYAVGEGTLVEPKKTTLGQWLLEWLKLGRGPKRPWSPATITRYTGIVTDHLVPSSLGSMPLQAVKAHHIEQYHAAQHGTFDAGTLSLHQNILQRALKKAARDRLVTRNEAKEVEAKPSPRHHRDEAGQDARVHCWTREEAVRFLKTAKAAGPQAAAFYSVLLDTGMRRGEVGGLKWADVDLDRGTIRIERQLLKPSVEKPVFGPTKTGTVRTIPLSAETVALLKAHKTHQAEIKMRNRRDYKAYDLVFAKEGLSAGAPLQVNSIGQREFARLVKEAGVKRIKFHGLRHTCATLLLGAREPLHVVSQRLGHANPTVTLQVYAHAIPDQQATAAFTIGSLIHVADADTDEGQAGRAGQTANTGQAVRS